MYYDLFAWLAYLGALAEWESIVKKASVSRAELTIDGRAATPAQHRELRYDHHRSQLVGAAGVEIDEGFFFFHLRLCLLDGFREFLHC